MHETNRGGVSVNRDLTKDKAMCKHGRTKHVYCADCHVERLQAHISSLESRLHETTGNDMVKPTAPLPEDTTC